MTTTPMNAFVFGADIQIVKDNTTPGYAGYIQIGIGVMNNTANAQAFTGLNVNFIVTGIPNSVPASDVSLEFEFKEYAGLLYDPNDNVTPVFPAIGANWYLGGGAAPTLAPGVVTPLASYKVMLTDANWSALLSSGSPVSAQLDPQGAYTLGDDNGALDFGDVSFSIDPAELFSQPTVTGLSVTDASGNPIALDGLDAKDAVDGVVVAVTFSKPIAAADIPTDFLLADDNGTPIGLVSEESAAYVGATHKFSFLPTAGQDVYSVDFSVDSTAAEAVVDEFGNVLDTTGLSDLKVAYTGDTKAPNAVTLDSTYVWSAHGDLILDLSKIGVGERYEIYDGSGRLLGTTPSRLADAAAPRYHHLKDLPEGGTNIKVKVFDSAGNSSSFSTELVVMIDRTPPEVLSITKADSNLAAASQFGSNEAGFLVKFSEAVAFDPSAFSVTGVSSGVTRSIYGKTDTGWSIVSTNTTAYSEIFVKLGALGLSDLPALQVTPLREAIEFVYLTGAPAEVTNVANSNWLQIKFDGELPEGEVTSASLNLKKFGANGEHVDAQLTHVSKATDPTVLYVASTTPFPPLNEGEYWVVTSASSTSPSVLGGKITDTSGNALTLDPGISDYYTLVGDETEIIKPETGPKGLDFIDLSALNGSVVIDSEGGKVTFTPDGSTVVSNVFDVHSFEGYTLTDNGGNEFLGSAYSEIVTVGDGDGNTLRANNRDSGDKAPETDIVDYSQTTNAITVNLGNNASADITVSRAGLADGDVIAGFEGVIGSQGADTITGSGIGNFLAGAEGADQIFGMAGDDILIGGAGADEIHGGAGSDLIIDLDGGDLYGSETEVDRDPDEASENDVFVVRTGSSIHNFHLSGDGTGLAGRSGSANDAIIFSISLAALAVQVDLTKFLNEQDEVIDEDGLFEFVGKNLVFNDLVKVDGTDDQRLVVKFKDGATLYDVGDVTLKGLSAQLEATEAGGKNYQASVVELDWLTDQFNINLENFNSKIDLLPIYKSGQGDDIGELAFAVALEAVREGTVRGADSRGVMAGNQSLDERIYNPGFGDERIIGASGKDRYEFLLQTLSYKDAQGNDVPSAEAGTDRVFDIGGYDVISFSDVALNELHFSAVKVGREAGANSLKVTYSQTAQIDGVDVVNNGEIIWQGHFKEGGRMAAEALEIGPAASASKYVLAQTKYAYDENGYVLGGPRLTAGDTKDASGNDLLLADTLLIGRGDSDVFVFETSSAPTTDGTNDTQAAHIWNFNTGDLIDVSDYVDDFGSLTVGTLTTTPATATGASTAAVDLTFSDGGGANDDLVLSLTFYDAGLTQLQLEEALGLSVPA